ncbi:GPP34 family phosphoprotein [Micromonospora sp. CPCC 205371]|nr:GPP34 family phosphoprotein [Micromonospora sp. CPCC 205371]
MVSTRPATGLRIADELFLIAYDRASAHSRTAPWVTGPGMAAALLGELVLDGSVTIASGSLVAVDRWSSADPDAHPVLARVAAEPRHLPVRRWLDLLAPGAMDAVGQRMVRAGLATRSETRRLWRTTVRYWPVDGDAASASVARLRDALAKETAMTVDEVTLAALVGAIGLGHQVLGDRAGRDALEGLTATLPAPLHELVVRVQAAVGGVAG